VSRYNSAAVEVSVKVLVERFVAGRISLLEFIDYIYNRRFHGNSEGIETTYL
jgi:hypothetical protein